jgi:DNA-binding IclR family transcriptional regulator
MTENTEGEADKRRRGIQSVEIGLGVLEALAALGEASTLGAIAQASGLSGPQTHRYLASLTAAGMTQQDRTTGRYDLGPAALKLGLSALARTDAFRVADTAIEAFVRETGRTVQVAALGPQGPTVVRWHMGRPAVMTSFGVGAVLPLLYSATGHIFLSFMPDVEIDPLLDRELPDSDMTRADVEAIRKRVRADGRAYVEGTVIPGLRAAAFPIFDLQGRAILSATALVPGAYKADDSGAVLDKLAAACREVSESLGWSG